MEPITPEEASKSTAINNLETTISRKPHTAEELRREVITDRGARIASEFDRGLQFIKKYPKSVTIYGSARFKTGNPHYRDAYDLAHKLSKLGYAIVTGGGPGVMEGANHGAKSAGGASIGLNIELPSEQVINPYVTDSLSFYYFFARKTTMSLAAEAYIFYPGGFGTLDEFFEILTLVQTKKIRKIPIILIGSDFWKPLQEFLEEHCYQRHAAVEKNDFDLYLITDSHDEVIKTLLEAPVRR